MKAQFETIYHKHGWNGTQSESISGPGSTLSYTVPIREHLPKLLHKHNIKSLLDAPCGDFNWMSQIVDSMDIEYTGGDIVTDLIQSNKMKYRDHNFIEIDIAKDPLPDADMMMVRDCLFHFSFNDINRFFENFKKSNIKYLLTTTHTELDILNHDIQTGGFRRIDLFTFPFGIKRSKVIDRFPDYVDPFPPREMVMIAREDI